MRALILTLVVLLAAALSGAEPVQRAMAQTAQPSAQPAPAKAQPGYLGVETADVTKDEAEKLGLDAPSGVRVVQPVAGGPAAQAGVQAGDVILSVDGSDVVGAKALALIEQSRAPGSTMRLRIVRDGRLRTLTVTLAARPRGPVVTPMPVIDTGGHTAKINDVLFTRDGRYIVSAGEDKTIRVWDWRTGKLDRVIRGEASAGDAGKIFAIALSPDERWLAVGGWLGGTLEESRAIRLYDFASGRLVRLLKGHTNVVFDLAFAPDSRRLVSGGADTTAIVWDVETGAALHRLEGHSDHIYAVRVTPDGQRVVTGSYDSTLRLWRLDTGAMIGRPLTGHGDKIERGVVISPNGGTIASGDRSGEIRIWDARTGAFQRTLARQGTVIGALAFSPDGRQLLSAVGKTEPSPEPDGARIYDVATGREAVRYTAHDNIVIAATISPDGQWAATGGGDDHEIHVWALADGTPARGADGRPVILKGTGRPAWATGVALDGRTIAWGNIGMTRVNEATRLEHQLRLPDATRGLGMAEPVTGPTTFARATPERGGLRLANRRGGAFGSDALLDVIRDGTAVATVERGPTDGYDHRAYSFTPDGRWLVSSGSAGHLAAYAVADVERAAAAIPGRVLKDDALAALAKPYVGHESTVWAVTPSPDGRLLVTGSDDQTVRIWNLATQELLLTLAA
jgi:WD40 repeat protein